MNIIKESEIFYIGTPEEKDAYITFVVRDGILTVEHTVVSENHKGKGLGKVLVQEVANYAREKGWKVNSTCWFADGIFQKEEQYKDILA